MDKKDSAGYSDDLVVDSIVESVAIICITLLTGAKILTGEVSVFVFTGSIAVISGLAGYRVGSLYRRKP